MEDDSAHLRRGRANNPIVHFSINCALRLHIVFPEGCRIGIWTQACKSAVKVM